MGPSFYDNSKGLEFQMQIGFKLFSEYPIRSLAESVYQLRKALGIHASNAQMHMVQQTYRENKLLAFQQKE